MKKIPKTHKSLWLRKDGIGFKENANNRLIENPFDVCWLFEDKSPGDCVRHCWILVVKGDVAVFQDLLKRNRTDFSKLQLRVAASNVLIRVRDVEDENFEKHLGFRVFPPEVWWVDGVHPHSLLQHYLEQCELGCDDADGQPHKTEKQQTPRSTCNSSETWHYFLDCNKEIWLLSAATF